MNKRQGHIMCQLKHVVEFLAMNLDNMQSIYLNTSLVFCFNCVNIKLAMKINQIMEEYYKFKFV